MIIYDSRGMEWPQYCRLVTELFAQHHLGHEEEDKWQEWANRMRGTAHFSRYSIPDPYAFNSWREWAEILCGIIMLEG